MSIEKMMTLHPQAAADMEVVGKAARHAMLCALMCTSCADACLAEPTDMAAHIRACLDCADVCTATGRLLVRQTGDSAMLRRQLEACIAVCRLCAADCARHDHPHCQLCRTMCDECATDCEAALAALG